MYSILALCLLAVLAVGGQARALDGPKPCCFPPTWGAVIRQKVFFQGKSSPQFFYGEAYTEQGWDTDNKKIAYRIQGIGDGYYKRYVVDAAKHYAYSITKDACLREKFKSIGPMTPACVPDAAKYQNSYKLGADEMKLNVFNVDGALPGYGGEMDVTSDTCMPVFSTYNIDIDNANVLLSGTYFNVTSKILDSTLFDIPSDCADGSLKFDNHRLDILGLQIHYGSAPYVMGNGNKQRINNMTKYTDKYLRF